MNKFKKELRVMMAFIDRTFMLVKRQFAWEIAATFYDVINAITIGLIGVVIGAGRDGDTVLYLVIGALFWGYMSVIFNEVANNVTWERWEGTIEYTFMAPIRRITHLLGVCSFAVIYGLLRMSVVLLVLAFFFSFDLEHANLWSALTVMIFASPAFMGLGLLAAVLPLLSPERGTQGTHIIQGFILLVSGIYYPITILPQWLQVIAQISPGTYALEAARAAMLKGATFSEIWPQLLSLVVIGIFLIPIGLVVFRTAEQRALRTGKLKRNG